MPFYLDSSQDINIVHVIVAIVILVIAVNKSLNVSWIVWFWKMVVHVVYMSLNICDILLWYSGLVNTEIRPHWVITNIDLILLEFSVDKQAWTEWLIFVFPSIFIHCTGICLYKFISAVKWYFTSWTTLCHGNILNKIQIHMYQSFVCTSNMLCKKNTGLQEINRTQILNQNIHCRR